MAQKITIIVAAASNNAIGKDNQLLWHLSEDLKRFKQLTNGHAIIMGRKTFESLPKALPNRTNIVITHNAEYQATDAIICQGLQEALDNCLDDPNPFIIGGGEIYKQGLVLADTIELTRIHRDFEGDTFFPDLDPKMWTLTHEEKKISPDGLSYSFLTYQKNK